MMIDCTTHKVFSLPALLSQMQGIDLIDEADGFNEDWVVEQGAEAALMLWALRLMCESGLGRTLAYDARFDFWKLQFDTENAELVTINREDKVAFIPLPLADIRAVIRSPYFRQVVLLSLMRALRDIWHENSRYIGLEALTLQDRMVFERCRAADVDICLVYMGWQIKQAGIVAPWRQIVGSAEGDIALNLQEMAEDSANAINLSALYESWMLDDERLEATDQQSLQMFDQLLYDNALCRGDKKITQKMLEQVTQTGNGSYLEGCNAVSLTSVPMDHFNAAHYAAIVEEADSIRVDNVTFRDASLARLFMHSWDDEAVYEEERVNIRV